MRAKRKKREREREVERETRGKEGDELDKRRHTQKLLKCACMFHFVHTLDT